LKTTRQNDEENCNINIINITDDGSHVLCRDQVSSVCQVLHCRWSDVERAVSFVEFSAQCYAVLKARLFDWSYGE